MPTKHDHRSRRVVATCLDEVWAIDPFKLEQICGFLDLRASGYTPTADEVQVVLARDGRVDDQDDEPEIVDGVVQLGLFGVMAPRMNMLTQISGGTSTQQFAAQLRQAGENEAIRTVVVEVDSPGGVVTGTEELRRAMVSLAARKRVVAIARGMMTSAAYYASAGATELVATPSSQVGSIGVYAIHREITKAAEDAGVKFRVFRAGEYKAAGIEVEKLTETFASVLQERIEEPYRQFVAAVAVDRSVTTEAVENRFGQGRTFLAAPARERGMIDEVLGFDELISRERQSARGPITKVGLSVVGDAKPPEQVLGHDSSGRWIFYDPNDKPRHAAETKEEKVMHEKVKAALVAKGLVRGDASNDQSEAVLSAAFRARGENVPNEPDDIVKAMFGWDAIKAPEPAKIPEKAPVPAQSGPDEAAVRLQERNRIADLRARGSLLEASDEDIATAIDGGLSSEQACSQWIAAKLKANKPVASRIETGESEYDQSFTAAAAVLAQRCQIETEMPPHARDMANMSLLDIGRRFVKLSGGRPNGDQEADALEFLKLGGTDRKMFASEAYAAGPAFNRPGDFPNLLSALAGKILDTSFDLAEVTYPDWCARMGDAADFKPRTIIAAGVFDDLDLIMDDEDPKSLALTEELMQWISVDRYANKVGLTPVMVANDDLDAFSTQLQSLAFAHESKINTLAVQTVANNPTMPDTKALFLGETADHYNLVASGAAVSSSALSTMRLRHRLQPGVGTTKKKIKSPPKICLVPPGSEEAAIQALAPLIQLEQKAPATDATINTVRGQMRPIVENEFADYDTAAWYTLADPNVRRTIVYSFMRGYGRGGQRETWFENGRKTRYVALEGRFAVVAASWRGIVKNPGA